MPISYNEHIKGSSNKLLINWFLMKKAVLKTEKSSNQVENNQTHPIFSIFSLQFLSDKLTDFVFVDCYGSAISHKFYFVDDFC